jgi:pimeloyl-ACP methyl ester carboxylesterase
MPTAAHPTSITLDVGAAELSADLHVPDHAEGLVIFAHGSGSSRTSPRNQFVARVIQHAGMGTLLFDLLTPDEAAEDALTGALRFDIAFLAERLRAVADRMRAHESTRGLAIGYFGASTGAAAALAAAAEQPDAIRAVVTRGGRPDLAARYLPRVRAPALLLVGGADTPVVYMNQRAYELLECEKQLTIIPGASHLFEEPGTLDQVARFAADWFQRHLATGVLTPAAGRRLRDAARPRH